jgi:hypothetical protein
MRCPVCRADNVAGAECRRCRADLGLLTALEEQRLALLRQADRLLAHGAADRALALARQAEALRRGPEPLRRQALAHLLRRRFADAVRCWLRAAKDLAGRAGAASQ